MPIKTKDHDKCKEWERRRRDRLNDAFKNLAQLLPHYDPAKIPAKIDILEKSTEFVKELRLSNSRLLSKQAENDEKCKLIKELQDEVNKLILRVKQLTILLRKAKISIPTGPAIKALGSKRLKWSGKIKPNDVENSNVIPKPNPVVLSPVKDAESKDTTNNPSSNPSIPPVTIAPSEATISSTPSIIIPLKEPNSTKPSDMPKPVDPLHASPPQTTASSFVSSSSASKTFTTTVVSATLPTPTLLSEPIFTTSATPLQLPLQTIFLTPCSLTGQTSQLLTRITLPAPILPRPLDGHSLQKIPIRQVLKPIPKIIKRRRKRTKKIVTESTEKSSAGATSSNSSTPPTSKEAVIEKVLEKEPNDVSEQANPDASVHDEVVSIPIDEPLTTAVHVSPSKESSDNENVPKVPEKEKAASNSERNDGEVDSVQDKIAEKVKAVTAVSDVVAEITNTPSLSMLETDKSIPETGATREVAESDSIPVLRIIDDESQVNENSSIFSCVIVEDQQAENEKTSNEDLSTIPTPKAAVTEEMQQGTNATVEEVAVPMPPPLISRHEEVTDSIIVAEKQQPDKELPSNQTSDISERNACMEQMETGRATEAMETDVLSKSTEADKLDGNGSDQMLQLLPKPLDNLNITPVDSTEKLTASNIPEPVTPVSSQELEQPAVVTIPIAPISTNDALPSTSSIIKPTDYALSTPVKQISPSLGTIRQLEAETNDNVTTDKISECIARSIDLIDANDSELMELGEHWETGGSPKSPISPTQMFLNIFPLLPRENSMNEQQQQQQQQHQPPTQTTPQKSSIPFPSSSSRSSFFIDAMLPDDHSVNNSATIHESDMEMISSNTSQSQCLALTPPQFSASISHSIASSLTTPNTSYYWNTASCSVENSMDFRGAQVPPRNVINSVPTPMTITSTAATSVTTTKSNVHPSTSSNATSFYSSVSTAVTTTPTSASVNSKTTASESPRKSSKSKQSSTGLPSYASKSKSSSATSTSVTWAVTTTPSHSFNVSNSQQLSTPSVQSLTQLHSTSVSASGSQSHSHSCSLLDALNPMDASFFRPLINALDSHDFRALEFPPTTPLPPPPAPLPPLIPPTKPLYTPQFSSNQQGVQNQMSVSYHQPIAHDQNVATIPSSIIHHHHHHHPSLFSNTGVGNTEHSTATIQDLGSSRKQHQLQHSSTHQSHSQPLSQLAPPIPQPSRHEALATTKSNQAVEKPEKTSRASSKQGKSESSRQSRSGKSSRTQPYTVPSSVSACSQAASSTNAQRQQQAAFVSHTPYHTNTNHLNANQSSNSALKSSGASSSKNQQLYTPHTPSISTNLGISANIPQQQHQSQHYSSHTQQHQSVRQASTVKVSEAKSPRTKHDERSQANQNQSKSRIYQNLPQQAAASHVQPQPPSSTQNVVSTTQSQAVVGNSASSGVALATNQHQSHHIAHKSQPHHQNSTGSNTNTHAFQFHSSDSFQLFPDFGSNMPRQFNAHSHPSESSTNFNLQPSSSQSNATTTSNFPVPSQRSHHPYYLPDISSTSFDNFTVPIPPATQQIHSNAPARQPAGVSSCHQSSKYTYGSSTPNVSQQIAASSANRMPQTPSQPVQAPGPSPLFHQPAQRHHHAHQEISYSHTPQHQPSSHTQQIQAIPHSQAQTVPPPVRVTQRQTQGHESCQQTQQRSQTHQSTSASSKAKQVQVQSVPTVNYPPPNIQQPPTHHLHQHQQQHVQSQNQQQQQHVPSQTQQHQHVPNQSQQPQQQTSRPSASRTVNWMTDTGYRTTSSSTNTNTGSNNSNKQCIQQSGPANNPFSVSKLVGITPTAPTKPQQSSNIDTTIRNQQPQQQQQSSSTSSNISNVARNKSSSSTNPSTSIGNNSNTQSSYCAEALIRKNPDWENFNSSTNTNFPNYPSHPPSSSSHDHFPNYSNLGGSYQYSSTSSGSQHTASSHFSHFGGTQPQHFHTSHHQQHQHQPQPSSFHSSQHQPQSHTIHPHTQQSSQIHYQHHHQHHPHQSHGTSTSSVSNFNLSTIFPEINDKRAGSNSASQGGSGSNVGRSTGTGAGNMTTFNYHHPAFPGNTGNSHQ
ncbi:hypothetical protein Ocin01_03465 [Orchesella cincta]|uniref:BHLH domain-containing protein n=1 Tax=Orchesella cincta TaxID=48709 RepID=A0A1D2NDC0_ORCCI|nr:hypothetical protein Ocin01_03465 [Orchesella cincta]